MGSRSQFGSPSASAGICCAAGCRCFSREKEIEAASTGAGIAGAGIALASTGAGIALAGAGPAAANPAAHRCLGMCVQVRIDQQT